jgi:hypothetical protein
LGCSQSVKKTTLIHNIAVARVHQLCANQPLGATRHRAAVVRKVLRVFQLAVDMSQFCQLVVPQLTRIDVLVFHLCNDLDAADIELLSAALTRHAVKLQQLVVRVQDDDDSRLAIASLFAAHPTIRELAVDNLDDSRRDVVTGQSYALIAALMRPTTPTRRLIGLESTRVPTPAALRAIQPLDPEKLTSTQFYLANREFATLATYIACE